MEYFTLINKANSRIKVLEPFEDSSKNTSIINAILISYGCVFKRSSKPVLGKALGLNLSKKLEKNIEKLLEERWEKLIGLKVF